MNYSLPMGSSPKPLEYPHFPTRQQAVVWRNWGMVPMDRIARILKTSVNNIIKMAEGLGLQPQPPSERKWLKRGYITIIRNNWHLLNYDQLLELLDWTPEELAYTLKEDDFLWHKLGQLKPDVEPVFYSPLSEEEEIKTMELKKLLEKHFPCDCNTCEPFGFLERFISPVKLQTQDYGTAGEREITIDSSWSIYTLSTTGNIEAFVDRFIQNHADVFGLQIQKLIEPACKHVITLDISPDPELPAESHKVEISQEYIKITSVDEAGLLRGLQWIEKEMESRKGPFIKRGEIKRRTRFDLRMIYTYFGIYGDSLIEPEFDPYPEGLLSEMSKRGINAVWLQGVLYKLVPFDWAPELSSGWEKRIDSLKRLVKRAARYGIGVYLYLNEPRAIPFEFFTKYPELKGSIEGEFAAMCTSQKQVQDYLRNGVKRLFTEVDGLAGLFTITMSENLTNCHSRAYNGKIECPRCVKRSPEEVVAEVNRIISDAAHSVKPDARVICYAWAWKPEWGERVIELLPHNAEIMCVSEDAIPTSVAGIDGKVLDYSMSVVGPGEIPRKYWNKAKSMGMKAIAKVQFNNTWECSAVPYLPVMDLVNQHIEKLAAEGVNGLMLSWTLGGYPSLNLDMASEYYWESESGAAESLDAIAVRKFGEKAAPLIASAWSHFSQAFQEFPFNIGVLYNAPQNFGPMNLLYEKSTGYNATMIGFPYDDLTSWRAIYPEDIFEEQLEKLSSKWKEGIVILDKAKDIIDKSVQSDFEDLRNISLAVYCHFRSTYLQVFFIRLRNQLNDEKTEQERQSNAKKIIEILDEEIEVAKVLYNIAARDSRIGYEASNHYYYTLQNLKEKVINCEFLKKIYETQDIIHICMLKSNQTIAFAGKELKKYIARMLGSDESISLELKEKYDASEKNALWLGTWHEFGSDNCLDGSVLPVVDDSTMDDAIYIDAGEGKGVISGVNDRSVLLAVYRFLTEAGCRWVRPGEDGEYIPLKDLTCLSVNVCEKAAYRHRGICVEGAVSYENVADIIDWAPKVGFNSYFIQFREAYAFFDRWYKHKNNSLKQVEEFTIEKAREFVRNATKEIKKRGLLYQAVGHGWTCEPLGVPGLNWDKPEGEVSSDIMEYVAEVDGKREFWGGIPLNTNLCYSNPEVRRMIINSIAGYLQENKELDVLHFWLADGNNNQCECKNCIKEIPSDYYVSMLNDIDAHLTEKCIDTKIAFLIYFDLLWTPVKERIKNPDRFILMYAPITRTYSKEFRAESTDIELPEYRRNKLQFSSDIEQNLAFLKAWQQIFKGDSFDFDYHMMWDHFNDPGYFKIADLLNRDIKHLKDIGLNGFISCQVQRAFFPTGLAMYVMGKTLWDERICFDEISRDYFYSSFGHDGDKCRKYLAEISELFDPPYLRNEKPQIRLEVAERLSRIGQTVKDFLPVIESNLNLNDRCHTQSWIYLQYHAEICMLLATALEARARGDREEALVLWEKTKNMIMEKEDILQPVLDTYYFIMVQGARFE